MKHVIAALAVSGLFLSSIAAAEPPEKEIVVTATRTAQTADEALAAVTVITREQIDAAKAKDVPELLRFHAGLDVARSGGPGQITSVFLRGTDSNHVLVLVDGVRINPGTIGAPAWQNLSPDVIERIEIVRGPRSSLYGSDAIGGVVQIFTRRAEDGTTLSARAGDGSFVTRDGAAGVHHRSQYVRAGVDVARLTSEGFPARVGGTDDSGFQNTSVNAYTGVKLGSLDVEIGHWQARAEAEYYDFFLTPVSHDLFNSVTGVTLKAPLTSWWAMSLKPSEMRDEIDQNQSSDYAHTRRQSLDWQNDFQIGRNDLLTFGTYRTHVHTSASVFGSAFREQTESWAAFVQNQWKPGNNSLLTAFRYNDYDGFGQHTTGEIAYGYRFGPAAQLFVSTATGFRAPDSTDRFGFGGNPTLLPEQSKHAELGARLQLAPAHRLNLQAFWNEIDNLINYVDPDGFGGPLPGMNQNIDRARIRGIELGYRYNQGPWRLNAEGISQNPENLDTHRQLARRAAHSLTLGGGYSTKSYSLAFNVLAQDSRWDSDFSSTRLPAYVLVNLLGDYPIAPDWTLGARIENLFNESYTLAEGYNTAGRAYYIDLRYRRTLHKVRNE